MELTVTETLWRRLGRVHPCELTQARHGLHQAAQVLAALGLAMVAPRPDGSHGNLLWSTQRQGFFGRRLPSGHRGFLEPESFQVGLLDSYEREVDAWDMEGITLAQALARMEAALRKAGLEPPEGGLPRPAWGDLPEPPRGELLDAPDPKGLEELSRWYHDAAVVLAGVASSHQHASEVHCWPQHFNIATLITLEDAGGQARSISVGMNPGDAEIPQPYFYARPMPRPAADALPALGHGAAWHQGAWLGAVLKGEELAQHLQPIQQMDQASDALREALRVCLGLLPGSAQ